MLTDDKVQIIVPNGAVWGQPLRNFSIYPPLPHTGEVRFVVADGTENRQSKGVRRGRGPAERAGRSTSEPFYVELQTGIACRSSP